MNFLTGNRQSSSTNSPPVIDCLAFWGMWAAREEGCWTCKQLIPSSGESKLVIWVAVDGPWMEMEMEIVMAAWQKHLDLGQKQIDICFWSGIQEIRVYMRAAGLKVGFSFGRTPHLWPPCCWASFAAMLFELEGSTISLTVAESSETTTGSVAEVDADWELWLVCAYFEGGSEASELLVWCGESMYPRIQAGLHWSGQSISFVLTLLLQLVGIE